MPAAVITIACHIGQMRCAEDGPTSPIGHFCRPRNLFMGENIQVQPLSMTENRHHVSQIRRGDGSAALSSIALQGGRPRRPPWLL